MRYRWTLYPAWLLVVLVGGSWSLAAATESQTEIEQLRRWAALGRVEDVRQLSERIENLDLNGPDEAGWTALMYAAKQGQVEMMKLLVELGANQHAGNNVGETALHIAAMNNRVDAIGALLDLGVDLRATDQEGRTALYRAVQQRQAEATELLQAEGQARQERDPSLGGSTTSPEVREMVLAEYTDYAKRERIEGDVLLRVLIHRNGTVGASRVVRGLDPELDKNALRAIKKWTFAPAMRDGVPVHIVADIAVEFRLPEP